jgi:PAS domain-containing protein
MSESTNEHSATARYGRGLREERERFESAFDNAPIGMALIAMNGRWLEVTDSLCRITGYTGRPGDHAATCCWAPARDCAGEAAWRSASITRGGTTCGCW